MSFAHTVDAIECAYQDDESSSPAIRTELVPQEIIGCRWPCITLMGFARGVRFLNCDLRGAQLEKLEGAEYVHCLLFGATVPSDARLVDCQQRSLTTK